MKFLSIFLLVISCLSSSEAQTKNEVGITLLSVSSYMDGMKNGRYTYKLRSESPFRSVNKYSHRFSERADLNSGTFVTPQLFARKKIFKNFWFKGTIEYSKSKIDAEHTFYESWGTSSSTYNIFHFQQSGFVFSMAPQYQWLNKKFIYIHSGIESVISSQRYQTITAGESFGCFGGGPFSENSDVVSTAFESLLFTTSVGLKVLKNINVRYEIQSGFHINNSDYKILINRFWISRTF